MSETLAEANLVQKVLDFDAHHHHFRSAIHRHPMSHHRAVKRAEPSHTAAGTSGAVIHWAARYDLLIWLLTLGRERRFRERLLEPIRLQPGEAVLDVGCGTGSLAMAASRQVTPNGTVHGVDPSPAMIARARHKARKASADVTFEDGTAESLPYPDASFDVVLSTVMLHHVPRKARPRAVREMRRVLRAGGRLLIIDFVAGAGGGPIAHLHRHGLVPQTELTSMVSDAGFDIVESGPLGAMSLGFVVGRNADNGVQP